MPACAKDGDNCTGHGTYAPRKNTTSSSNVFVNGKGILRVDDAWSVHITNNHTGKIEAGSTHVFANGRGVARIGDHIVTLVSFDGSSCESSIAVGSGNVFVGD